MNLPYFAADTLGVTLYSMQSKLVANEVREIRLGPWRIDLPMDVTSDILTNHELGFWVTLAKTLRLYVIVREKENWLFVLNEASLKDCGAKTGFAGQTIKDRVLELKPAITGVFHWKGSTWEQVQYDGSSGMGA